MLHTILSSPRIVLARIRLPAYTLGLIGLRAAFGSFFIVEPLADDTIAYFALDNVAYHGKDEGNSVQPLVSLRNDGCEGHLRLCASLYIGFSIHYFLFMLPQTVRIGREIMRGIRLPPLRRPSVSKSWPSTEISPPPFPLPPA